MLCRYHGGEDASVSQDKVFAWFERDAVQYLFQVRGLQLVDSVIMGEEGHH